jgi:hypothetical protein
MSFTFTTVYFPDLNKALANLNATKYKIKLHSKTFLVPI